MGQAHDRIKDRFNEMTSMRELRDEFAILTDFAKAFQHSKMYLSMKHDCGVCHGKLSQIESIEQNFAVAMECLDVEAMRKCACDMVRRTRGEACVNSEIIDLFLTYSRSFVDINNMLAEEIIDAIFLAARGHVDPAHDLVLKMNGIITTGGHHGE